MFDQVNTQVAGIAGQVGTTPPAWNSGVYSMIRSLSDQVILPIAGVILSLIHIFPRSKVKLGAKMLKAIHAQENKKAAREDVYKRQKYTKLSRCCIKQGKQQLPQRKILQRTWLISHIN